MNLTKDLLTRAFLKWNTDFLDNPSGFKRDVAHAEDPIAYSVEQSDLLWGYLEELAE